MERLEVKGILYPRLVLLWSKCPNFHYDMNTLVGSRTVYQPCTPTENPKVKGTNHLGFGRSRVPFSHIGSSKGNRLCRRNPYTVFWFFRNVKTGSRPRGLLRQRFTVDPIDILLPINTSFGVIHFTTQLPRFPENSRV